MLFCNGNNAMPDYKMMYFLLAGAIADALDMFSGDLDNDSIGPAINLLKRALLSAEDIYINTAGRGSIDE